MNHLIELFKEVLLLSVYASILIPLILLVKKLFKNRLSPKWHYYIWVLLLIRLMIPYTPESSFSVYSFFYTVAEKADLPIGQFRNPLQNTITNKATTSMIGTGQTPSTNSPNGSLDKPGSQNTAKDLSENTGKLDAMVILSLLWMTVVLLFGLYVLLMNVIFAWKVKNYYSPLQDQRIYAILKQCRKLMKIKTPIGMLSTKKLRTPSLYVGFTPKILVSSKYLTQLSEDEIKYIFLHELSHYKRKDILINWILVLLQIVYFFHPLVWIAFRKIREDCEISCDAKALYYIHEEEHLSYGNTIIKLIRFFSESNFIPATAGMSKNKSSYKRRIHMIGNYKKWKWTSSAAAFILILTLAAAGLTSCTQKSGKQPNQTLEDSTTPESDHNSTASDSSISDSTTSDSSISDSLSSSTDTSEEISSDTQSSTGLDASTDNQTTGNGQKDSSSTPSAPTQGEASYYGNWVISKVLAYGSVGTYSKETAEGLIRKEVVYGADQATNFGDDPSYIDSSSSNPVYTETTITSNDFVANNRMTFAMLGITSDSVTQVDVTAGNTFVCSFLVKDENTLILSGGGTYFELVRK